MITFRPHPNEPSILDTFLTLFFSSELFTQCKEYKYNIEKSGTPDRHFHIFLTTDLRDKEKVYNYFSVKEFKQFKQWLLKKETEFTHGLNVVLVSDKASKRNDRLYRIGYVSKDTPSPYKDILTTNMDHALIKQGLDYMVEYDRIHLTEKDYSKDIKQLSIKNVIPEIMYYHKERGFPIDNLIFDRMAKEGVFTPSLTESQEHRIIHQLKVFFDKEIDYSDYSHVDGKSIKKMTFSEYCEKTGD